MQELFELLLTGTIDTLLMVGVSALVALLLGLPLAILLVITSPKESIPLTKLINPLAG